jgi:hypothetical protein
MAQHPLDNLIRKVDAKTPATEGGKIVMINRKTGAILLKKPSSWQFWKQDEVAYYLVFSGVSVKQKGLTYDIDDFKNDRTIGIQIDYQATCLPGKEEEVVRALYDDSPPSVMLENKIISWVRAFTTRWEKEFIDDYPEKIEQLQNNMEQRAEREITLSIQFRLTSNLQLPESLPIGPLEFLVQVTDCPNDLNYQVTGELDVLDKKIAHNRRDQLEALVKREIQTDMARRVTLHDYYFGSDEQLILWTKKHLDEVLASQGRKVERLFIKREKPPFSNDIIEVTKEVNYTMLERSEPVTIVSTLQMELQNAGQYVKAGAPKLENWVQKELDNIIPKVLFGTKYIDMLLAFKPREAEIKNKMTARAESIGYSLWILISVPNLEPLALLKNFDIDVPGTLFPTKIDQAEVKLEISVTARIQNLKDIEKYLNQQQDVKQLMKEAILNETRRFLRAVEPEDFYIRFSFSPDGEKGVEQKLIDLLTDKLSDEFKATVIKVDLKRLNTELADRLRDLEASPPCPFGFKVNPLTGGEQITFFGKFQVDGVDPSGWYQFQKRKSSLEEIRDHIQEAAWQTLETFSSEHLEFKWYEEQESLKEATAHIMQQSATQAFGVAIRILNFGRGITEYEKKQGELKRKLEQEKLLRLERELLDKQKRQTFDTELKQLAKDSDKRRYEQLLKKREEMIEDGLIDDADELAELEAEIIEKNQKTEDDKSNEDELLREFKALEDARPKQTRTQELLTRVTQSEKPLPGTTSTSKVESLPKHETVKDGQPQTEEYIEDVEVIRVNKSAQPPQSDDDEHNQPIK